ncbi:hypothetical protein L1987_68183 [Smallanthus sonchifolius]|uniref:Uncharacterized protein n=1 Tax=Smallanthus sonchifolius TaxID=185202 RepID=A0ACB9B538_9ASTR|nr:hypothetical protein L1987_68183 [Smallanthus sonchifolius]
MEAANFVLQLADYLLFTYKKMIANCTRAKFGGYGSFLPTYQRSPAGPHSKTSPKVHVNNTSPNDLHLQGSCEVILQNYSIVLTHGGSQNSVSISKSQTRHVPALTSGASPPRGPPGKVKQEVLMSSTWNGLGKVEVLTIQQMGNVSITYRVTIYGTDAELDLHIPFMMFQSKKTARNGLD